MSQKINCFYCENEIDNDDYEIENKKLCIDCHSFLYEESLFELINEKIDTEEITDDEKKDFRIKYKNEIDELMKKKLMKKSIIKEMIETENKKVSFNKYLMNKLEFYNLIIHHLNKKIIQMELFRDFSTEFIEGTDYRNQYFEELQKFESSINSMMSESMYYYTMSEIERLEYTGTSEDYLIQTMDKLEQFRDVIVRKIQSEMM